jgi:hypothetical protein
MRDVLAAVIVGALYAMLFLLFLIVGELRTQTEIMQPTTTIQSGE